MLFDARYLESEKASDGAAPDSDQYLYLPGLTRADVEQAVIERAVRRNGGSKSKASEELKSSRSTVIKRMGGVE